MIVHLNYENTPTVSIYEWMGFWAMINDSAYNYLNQSNSVECKNVIKTAVDTTKVYGGERWA